MLLLGARFKDFYQKKRKKKGEVLEEMRGARTIEREHNNSNNRLEILFLR